jgi:hypothetical protein
MLIHCSWISAILNIARHSTRMWTNSSRAMTNHSRITWQNGWWLGSTPLGSTTYLTFLRRWVGVLFQKFRNFLNRPCAYQLWELVFQAVFFSKFYSITWLRYCIIKKNVNLLNLNSHSNKFIWLQISVPLCGRDNQNICTWQVNYVPNNIFVSLLHKSKSV